MLKVTWLSSSNKTTGQDVGPSQVKSFPTNRIKFHSLDKDLSATSCLPPAEMMPLPPAKFLPLLNFHNF